MADLFSIVNEIKSECTLLTSGCEQLYIATSPSIDLTAKANQLSCNTSKV